MKKLLILLVMLLVSCAPEPEIVYVYKDPIIIYKHHDCYRYSSRWDFVHKLGATGMLTSQDDYYVAYFIDVYSGAHELGHADDYEKGLISDTVEFQEAVIEYYYNYSVDYDTELFTWIAHFYETGNYKEVYAELYAYNVAGSRELPKDFTDFFK